MPERLAQLPRVTVGRGDWHRPAPGYSFTVSHPVTVYLAVDRRGDAQLDPSWERTDLMLTWGENHHDLVYRRDFPAGAVTVPGNSVEHTPGAYGLPHAAFIESRSKELVVTPSDAATATMPDRPETRQPSEDPPVVLTLQIDVNGDGEWVDHATIDVPAADYVCHLLPEDLDATWMRLKTDRDCIITAFLHQTTNRFHDGDAPSAAGLFAGLADIGDTNAHSALVYAAQRNRNLRVITGDGRHFEFTKAGFEFEQEEVDPELTELLEVAPEFTVDEASVILEHRGQKLRLPKGDHLFDRVFASGWPRASREVESERHLANIHGTFYEVPLITNDQPPAYHLMRPVASHNKQIADFCSWNGLLVLSGVRQGAANDGHVFADAENNVALWFGGVDDLWKLGKPRGHGGPWKDTPVKALEPSDPYLMTGYDKKRVTLSADRDTAITMEVDFDHQSGWHAYKVVTLQADAPVTYEFPASFSAHWIRFIASNDCEATAQMTYQ